MYSLPMESVTVWENCDDFSLPLSVDFLCPFCSRKVNFGFTDWTHNKSRKFAHTISNCPGCRETVRFWAIDPVKYGDTPGCQCGELCVHPTPRLQRTPMPGLDKLPPAIAKGYVSAVNVLNSQEWNATATLVGRTLEALARSFMPADKQNLPLAAMLDELPATTGQTKTLDTLVHGLRKGRNLGAHFDLDKEVDEDLARAMVDFLEYFLEYLYILPGQVKELHARV